MKIEVIDRTIQGSPEKPRRHIELIGCLQSTSDDAGYPHFLGDVNNKSLRCYYPHNTTKFEKITEVVIDNTLVSLILVHNKDHLPWVFLANWNDGTVPE
jgi:hypothetical protein